MRVIWTATPTKGLSSCIILTMKFGRSSPPSTQLTTEHAGVEDGKAGMKLSASEYRSVVRSFISGSIPNGSLRFEALGSAYRWPGLRIEGASRSFGKLDGVLGASLLGVLLEG